MANISKINLNSVIRFLIFFAFVTTPFYNIDEAVVVYSVSDMTNKSLSNLHSPWYVKIIKDILLFLIIYLSLILLLIRTTISKHFKLLGVLFF